MVGQILYEMLGYKWQKYLLWSGMSFFGGQYICDLLSHTIVLSSIL